MHEIYKASQAYMFGQPSRTIKALCLIEARQFFNRRYDYWTFNTWGNNHYTIETCEGTKYVLNIYSFKITQV